MRITIGFITLILLILATSVCLAQTNVEVSDPRIELKDNIIHIYYDILDSSPSDKFNVEVIVTDEEGNRIDARALKGDVGEEIEGGEDKQIKWDLEVDNVFLKARIYFEVEATLVARPVSEEPEREESAQPKEEFGEGIAGETSSEGYKRTALILQSIALPGLGLTRHTGNPHWIRGVAGYGCIIGSVIYNQSARNSFNSIDGASGFDDKKDLFDTSVKQDNISEGLAYAAIGIWAIDIIWTIAGTSDMNKVTLGAGLDPLTSAPIVVFRYRF